jgi:hypothetical protein
LSYVKNRGTQNLESNINDYKTSIVDIQRFMNEKEIKIKEFTD